MKTSKWNWKSREPDWTKECFCRTADIIFRTATSHRRSHFHPGSALGSGIPTLEHLLEKKKPGSTLPNNFIFSSKGTLTYETLDLPDFVNGFLEFQKQQPDECKPGLTQHFQLLMARASTYQWSSVRSFHLSIATAIYQGRLSWSDCDEMRERSQIFFTHQDLCMHATKSKHTAVTVSKI